MVHFRHVGIEREAQVDLAEEQPGAELARYQIGVLALPADPGLLRQRLFHDWGGVDEHLQFARPARRDPAGQSLEPLLQRVVVVMTAGIDRNRAALGIGRGSERISLGGVIEPEHDDGARLRP